MMGNNLWKFDRNLMLNLIRGNDLKCNERLFGHLR